MRLYREGVSDLCMMSTSLLFYSKSDLAHVPLSCYQSYIVGRGAPFNKKILLR
jgi:hypothetical protein